MKKIVGILLASAVLYAGPAFAQEPAAAGAKASDSTPADRSSEANTSSDHREPQCSKDDPYIDYASCVNAHTRDKNAKVRMAQAAVAARRS